MVASFIQTRLTGALVVNLTSMQRNSNTPFKFTFKYTSRKRALTRFNVECIHSIHHTVLHCTVHIIYTAKTIKITVGLLFLMHTFPAESEGARRCSRSLATSRLPYLEATCRGVNPFCIETITGRRKNPDYYVHHCFTCGGSFCAVDKAQSCRSSELIIFNSLYHGVKTVGSL